MPVIDTSTLIAGSQNSHDSLQTYNGLDCCVTVEVFEEVRGALQDNPGAQIPYDFERAMQAPALEMSMRGVLVDQYQRSCAIKDLTAKEGRLLEILRRFATAVWGKGLNHNSPQQLKDFFYGVMQLPEQHSFTKGRRAVSTNREALEKLSVYFYARPIINTILALRDTGKKLSVLRTEVDSDSRLRTSYNVAGTETGRWSSSKSAEGTGTNLQNITEKLRRVVIADSGYKLAYVDMEQAESRLVAWIIWILFGDDKYLNACESGDLHTVVTRMVWPDLKWWDKLSPFERDRLLRDGIKDIFMPGISPAKAQASYDKKFIAESKFYRDYSYRDMSKRGGHGTNYYGQPRTMAKHLKVVEELMVSFQANYFGEFPGIREYHRWVARELGIHQSLTTPLGRTRHFFGRSSDDATLREAIAFLPQSSVGDLLNFALWKLWKYEPRIQVLMQIHDAIVFQYPDNDPDLEVDILQNVLRLMKTPLYARGRELVLPGEAKVGWNWGFFNPKEPLENPDGLMNWAGKDERQRREGPGTPRLNRLIS